MGVSEVTGSFFEICPFSLERISHVANHFRNMKSSAVR